MSKTGRYDGRTRLSGSDLWSLGCIILAILTLTFGFVGWMANLYIKWHYILKFW